jgi:hypothetical protein
MIEKLLFALLIAYSYLLSSLVSGSIFGLRVSGFVDDCLDGIHRLE